MRTVCRLPKISLIIFERILQFSTFQSKSVIVFQWSFNLLNDYLPISICLWIINHCLWRINHCLWRIIVFLGIINIVESMAFFWDFQYSGIKKTDFDLSTFLSTIKPFSDCLLSSKRLSLKGRKSMIQTKVVNLLIHLSIFV